MLNYGILEKIYSELGVKVIWFEDFDELPQLISAVFNLKPYSNKSDTELNDLILSNLNSIQKIEDEVPKYDNVNLNIHDIYNYNNYIIRI